LSGQADTERERERGTLMGVSYTFSSSRKYKSNYLVTESLLQHKRVCRRVFFDFTCLRRLFHHSHAGFQTPDLSAQGGKRVQTEEGD